MKLWTMPCRATQGRWVMMESSDKRSEEIEWRRNSKPIQYSCLENPMNSIKMLQYAIEKEQRNIARKNEEAGLKQKWKSIVDVSGGKSTIWWYKEQYCIGTLNVRSENQGKLDVARMNVCILGIGELKWMGMGEFNSDDHCIYYCGQQSLRRNGVALIVNKESKVKYLGTIQKCQQFSHSVMSDSLWPHGLQHARFPCPSPTLGACSNSCPSSRWKYIMWNARLDEIQAGIKMAISNISNLRYADNTILMAENEKELKSPLMTVKEGSG